MNNLWESMEQHNRDLAIYRLAMDYAADYIGKREQGPAFPSARALDALGRFDQALPAQPAPAEQVLQMLHEIGSPATTALGGGRYFGFVNGGVIPVALAARLLADVWDQNAGLQVMSPIAAKLEQVCEAWLVDLFALPAGTVAGLVSGTSTATLCGLLAGRNALLQRQRWDVSKRGLFAAPAIRVVISAAAHATVGKALGILGIGSAQIEAAPADDQGRFDAAQLPPLDDKTLLILQAGNVNSGAFDPFVPLCTAARQAGSWVHIDGAFGLWARASASTAQLTTASNLPIPGRSTPIRPSTAPTTAASSSVKIVKRWPVPCKLATITCSSVTSVKECCTHRKCRGEQEPSNCGR